MTAKEILEQIKALTAEEQTLVFEGVHQLEKTKPQDNYADDRSFEKVADKVMDRHSPVMKKLAQ